VCVELESIVIAYLLGSDHRRHWPNFCFRRCAASLRKTVSEILPEGPEWLLTTMLDNDDGLHEECEATVQAAQECEKAAILNCPTGIIIRDNRTCSRYDPSNAFISLSEPIRDSKPYSAFPGISSRMSVIPCGSFLSRPDGCRLCTPTISRIGYADGAFRGWRQWKDFRRWQIFPRLREKKILLRSISRT
jgi:hypothetical protein